MRSRGTTRSPSQREPIAVTSVATPWGPAAFAVAADGLHGVGLLTTPDELGRSVARRTGRQVVALDDAPPGATEVARTVAGDLDAYLGADATAGFSGWSVPVRLDGMSEWDRRVLGAVTAIPWGTTMSYGMVARAAGSPGAARAAGGAVARNPIGLVVPCHRVIAGDGTIGGYGGSWPADREALIALKRALLAHEGVSL